MQATVTMLLTDTRVADDCRDQRQLLKCCHGDHRRLFLEHSSKHIGVGCYQSSGLRQQKELISIHSTNSKSPVPW